MKVMVKDNIRFIFSVTIGSPHKCLIFGWGFNNYTHKSSLAAVDFLAFNICETWGSLFTEIKFKELRNMFTGLAEITKFFIFIEIQNTSRVTSLNFIFKAWSHCSSVSCCSCILSKVPEFWENSTKVFLTQSYISDDKEITPVFPTAGQKFLKYLERFFQFFPIFKNLYLFILKLLVFWRTLVGKQWSRFWWIKQFMCEVCRLDIWNSFTVHKTSLQKQNMQIKVQVYATKTVNINWDLY